MQPPAAQMESVSQCVVPHQKAQTTADDQCHQDQIQKRLPRRASERCVRSQNVKARIAKSRNRVENAHPEPPAQAVPGTEPERQQQCAGALAGQCHQQRPAGQPDDAADLQGTHRVHQHSPLVKADAAVEQKGDQGRDCHKAQSPDLDQQQNHSLSKY